MDTKFIFQAFVLILRATPAVSGFAVGAVPISAWRHGSWPGGGGAVPISAWRRGSRPGDGGAVLILAWRRGLRPGGGGVVLELHDTPAPVETQNHLHQDPLRLGLCRGSPTRGLIHGAMGGGHMWRWRRDLGLFIEIWLIHGGGRGGFWLLWVDSWWWRRWVGRMLGYGCWLYG
uniref:Uncharacterized protein n=1 Tax=Fagus sylvatica TaxID=28930 RepID=A0A2N9IM91_FAGSY